MLKHWPWIVLISIWSILLPMPAGAQTSANATLTPPQLEAFPRITTTLRVYNEQGAFVHGLEARDVLVIEDDRRIPPTELTPSKPGVQFVLALNLSRPFAIRDIKGISRYDLIIQSLEEWANSYSDESQNDLSLILSNGVERLHRRSSQGWINAIEVDQTDLRTTAPTMDVLARAIDVASDPTSVPGMGRAVLLLTPPPDRRGITALQSLSARAQESGVRIYVWMVSSADLTASQGAAQLTDLAAQTGGQFFSFTGRETLPNPDIYLEPLSHIYTLTYESRITTSDTHQVSARILTDDGEITTPMRSFELSVQPPNPIFVSPPLEITRQFPSTSDTPPENLKAYQPKQQPLEIMIEFPDDRDRSIERATLYVDGEIADQKDTPPFNKFTWEISEYTTNGTHLLQVEVVDELGLSGFSIETPIRVTLERPPLNVVRTLTRNAPLISGLVFFLIVSAFLLALIMRGHIRPRAAGRLRSPSSNSRRRQAGEGIEPITRPTQGKTPPARQRLSNWVNRISWPQRRKTTKAPAVLEPLNSTKGSNHLNTIPLTTDEITFGKDPTMATARLSDPSVEDLHARLRRNSEGAYQLFDEESAAGTWLNYAPISEEGATLEHGDIIHVGRVGFCFKLSQPKRRPKVIVIPVEPEP